MTNVRVNNKRRCLNLEKKSIFAEIRYFQPVMPWRLWRFGADSAQLVSAQLTRQLKSTRDILLSTRAISLQRKI